MTKSRFIGAVTGAMMLCSTGAFADVIMGIGAPLTGPNAVFGAQIQKGAEAAIAEINAAGGMNGEKITVVLGDDVSDPKQGVSVANKFVGEGVSFVVGHFNSGISIPASEIYAENNILEMTPAATNPLFTERGMWNTFRTCGRDDKQGLFAGKFIVSQYKTTPIAILHDKTPYGQGLADETKKTINAEGVTETVFEGINVGEKDFSALIAKMKQANVGVIYWGGLHAEAGLILRQMKDQGLKAQFIGPDGIMTNELASIAGDAVEGTLVTFGPDPRLIPGNAELVKKFRAEGFEPESFTLYSYAAVQALAQAAQAAGSNDPQEVAKALKEKGPFKTVLGDLSYDEKGDPQFPGYVFFKWEKDASGNLAAVQQQ